MNPVVEQLNAVLAQIKSVFVGKDVIVDLMGISLVAKENIFLLGPPGTAKSALVRELSKGIEDGKNFEYLLTRFTEPNEIFGPFDIRQLKEGRLVTNTEGMMPEASLVFFDEIFNANSAILNSLLMAINEKIFRRGKETLRLPALMFVGASNQLPEEEALNALLDRFLLRVKCDYVAPDLLQQVLLAGWALEKPQAKAGEVKIKRAQIIELQQLSKSVDLAPIRDAYIQLIHSIRNTGIKVSDRRAVKIQNLIAASATLCGRNTAILSDLWVLKYIWDSEEQIEILSGIVNKVVDQDEAAGRHPQAQYNRAPDPEELMKEVSQLQQQWAAPEITLEGKNVIKDKLRYLQVRADWIQHELKKEQLQANITELWNQILQSV